MTLKVDTFVVTSDAIVITHHQNEGMMVQCVLSCLFFFIYTHYY